MKSNTLTVVSTETISLPEITLVPDNPREEVRKLFGLSEPQSIRDLMQSEEFFTLQEEFEKELEDNSPCKSIDLDIFKVVPPLYDLRNAYIDFVEQRERLRNPANGPSYRSSIIQMALSFEPRYAGIPTLSIPVDYDNYHNKEFLLDWQKRCLALILRKQYFYPCLVVDTTKDEMSKDFRSQFKLKDRMQEYDKFKSALAEGEDKEWAMQHCFDRIGVSAYPFSDPPQVTGMGDIKKAMFDNLLNSKEKNVPLSEKTFHNFVRSVSIYRKVWPEAAKTNIQGSWIRGMTAIIESFDTNILKGTDDWIVAILEEAKNPIYKIALDPENNLSPVGLITPMDWTSRKAWQGNMHTSRAISSFAEVWNTIRKENAKLKKVIPALDTNPIIGLQNGAKMLKMEKS